MTGAIPLPVNARPGFAGPAHLRDGIFRALQGVVDPALSLSIVDVGLMYGVVATETHVKVHMTMTSPACPVTDVIVGDVEDALDKILPQDYTIAVEIGWEPPWDSSRMTPRARLLMGW